MTPADAMAAEKFKDRPPPADTPLRILRRAKRLRLIDVSESVGVTLGYLSQIEMGKNDPSLCVARKLANFFGVTIDELWPAAT